MNPQTINEYLEKFLPPTIALLVTGLVSVAIGIYLEKFKSRLTLLKYRLFFHPLATATQHSYWGNIAVYYNNRQTNHLSFVTIDITNDSNTDLEDVNIDFWVDPDSQILGQSGFYEQSGNAILLEQKHYNYFQQVIQRYEQDEQLKQADPNHITPTQLQNEINWILTNKKFHLPIFNRHTSIRLNLLTENFQGQQPKTRVSVLHKSVKLIEQEEKAQEDKKLWIGMIVWGLLSFILGVYLVQRNFKDSTTPLIIAGVLGILYLLFGFLIYKAIRLIKYLLA